MLHYTYHFFTALAQYILCYVEDTLHNRSIKIFLCFESFSFMLEYKDTYIIILYTKIPLYIYIQIQQYHS